MPLLTAEPDGVGKWVEADCWLLSYVHEYVFMESCSISLPSEDTWFSAADNDCLLGVLHLRPVKEKAAR